MKRGHVYTLVFMVACAVVLTLALALAYEAFKPDIAANRAVREQRAVLFALGRLENLDNRAAAERFEQNVASVQGPGPLSDLADAGAKPILRYEEGGQTVAYAVPFEGGALWGAIAGYIGVSADLSRTTGLAFTAQNETPGLGGRIEEEDWLNQFRGVPIRPDMELAYGQGDGWEIDAVTGATSTSRAVLRVLNQTLRERVFTGEGE